MGIWEETKKAGVVPNFETRQCRKCGNKNMATHDCEFTLSNLDNPEYIWLFVCPECEYKVSLSEQTMGLGLAFIVTGILAVVLWFSNGFSQGDLIFLAVVFALSSIPFFLGAMPAWRHPITGERQVYADEKPTLSILGEKRK